MKPSSLLHLYRVRLRARLVQECLALAGIAAGVALLFASQVSSESLQSSVAELSRGVFGRATLQLIARARQGYPEDMLARVRHIPGVRVAAPLLEQEANAIGPSGSASVELVGADASLSELGGALVAHTALSPFAGIGAVVLPAPLASAIGVQRFGQEVTFQVAGRVARVPLYAQLHKSQIGALTDSPVALTPLFTLQEIAGLPARVSRILVQSAPGAQGRVKAALTRLAAGRLDVEGVGYEQQLFAKAAGASNQSTALFSLISALVGFLFAFNAVLFTVPERRRLIADLRRDGYTPGAVIAVLLCDALMLGLCACALGLALGEELSIHLFHSNPAFLSLAFALGSERAVSLKDVAVALGGGMLAAIVAVLSPLADIRSLDPLAAVRAPEGSHGACAGRRRALGGLLCLALASAILLVSPRAAIPGMVLLLGALLLELPIILAAALAITGRIARALTGVVFHLAAMELGAVGPRALAIAATGAIAVFGSVAIEGAHGDLLRGLEGSAREANAAADVWVSAAGPYNLLATTPFPDTERRRLAHLPGVRAVRPYRSGLLDYGVRRVLVVAPPPEASPLIAPAELVRGDPELVSERVRAGGWLILSEAIAAEHHLHIGGAFTLQSPVPVSFRLAGLSTNLGWAPGAIVMNASDYARAWGSSAVSAYEVLLHQGVSPARGAREVERALGPDSGLTVQSAAAHAGAQQQLSREALSRLTQIATLIPIAAVLAMAAAIGALIWQRRPRLSRLKLEGLRRAELWRTILLQSVILVGVGCVTGAIFGLYGQRLADRALTQVVNFPVAYSFTALPGLQSLALVSAAALMIVAIPGYLAACAPAALALED